MITSGEYEHALRTLEYAIDLSQGPTHADMNVSIQEERWTH